MSRLKPAVLWRMGRLPISISECGEEGISPGLWVGNFNHWFSYWYSASARSSRLNRMLVGLGNWLCLGRAVPEANLEDHP
jgi:hypothetical protein